MIQIGRREFLCTGVAAACALGARRTWAQAATPPSKTITMAILGVGARGRQMLPVFLNQPGVRFLAVYWRGRLSNNSLLCRKNDDAAWAFGEFARGRFPDGTYVAKLNWCPTPYKKGKRRNFFTIICEFNSLTEGGIEDETIRRRFKCGRRDCT